MKEVEYIEGHEALKNFERLAIRVLQAPKVGGGRETAEKSSKRLENAKPKYPAKDRPDAVALNTPLNNFSTGPPTHCDLRTFSGQKPVEINASNCFVFINLNPEAKSMCLAPGARLFSTMLWYGRAADRPSWGLRINLRGISE